MIGYTFRTLTGKSPIQKKLKKHFCFWPGKTSEPAW